MIGAWGQDTDQGAPDPVTFVSDATEPIDVLDDGWWSVLQTPGLLDALLKSAHDGHAIRFLSCRPSRELLLLIGNDRIEIRLSDAASRLTVVRAGDAMLLSLRLDLESDQAPPLLRLQRRVSGGLFDRLSAHLEAVWECAEETVTDPHDFLHNVLEQEFWYEDEEDQDEDSETIEPLSHTPNASPWVAPERQPEADNPATLAADERAPRRWPRRPT